ncbi:ABC transporter permease [Sunxiuqinia sp. A32]|uniref:ABC transporter permease n=1 Tax=Sunxiuqinia sp. A32 TaxID=3461496 RepID=UPI004045ED39
MLDLDLWKEILSALKKNRMRSFMTAFGVFWGIFMLIIMSGAGKALENGVMDGIRAFASNSAFFWTERTSVPYEGFKRGRSWNYSNNDVEYIRQNVREIEYLSPRLFGYSQGGGDNTIRGERTGSFNIYGDYPDYFKIDPWTPIEGRLINEIDVKQKRKVCIIGERVREVMFDKDEDAVGQYLKVSGVYFQVVGVIHPETRIGFGGRKEETIIIPFSTMQQAYNYGDDIHFFSVTSEKGTPVSVLEEKLKTLLKKRHHIAPEDNQAVASFNIEVEWIKYSGLFKGIQLLTWIVGIGTLFAGVIGVSNIMLVIIKERTQEIGIQRAIGATPGKIITHIVAESVFLTTMAGYIGLSLGVGLLELANMALESGNPDEIFFRRPEFSFDMAMMALAVLIISGILAGLIPAKRAISIKPIDAIRDE